MDSRHEEQSAGPPTRPVATERRMGDDTTWSTPWPPANTEYPDLLISSVSDFDDWVDTRVEPLRRRPGLDRLAAMASFLGDHGLVWFLVLVARIRRPGLRRRSAVRAVLFTGLVVPVVNGALKSLVDRSRPAEPAEMAGLRPPSSASFPSGHSLAAWCAATMLAEDDSRAAVYYATAAAVSWSRIHLRHHHATDVVGGSVLGCALGAVGRRIDREQCRRR